MHRRPGIDGSIPWSQYTEWDMNLPIITIEEIPTTPEGRAKSWLRGRRLALAAGLALAEILAYLIFQPSRILSILCVGAVLALCIALGGRVKREGIMRDLLMIVGLAQGMIIALPVLAGVVSLVLAGLIVMALIAFFIMIGLRFRQ